MPNGSTSKLTPELAEDVVILRSENHSYREICRRLREPPYNDGKGYKVSPPDITHWIRQKREVELYGDVRSFADMMAEAEMVRTVETANELVEIADTAEERGEKEYRTKHRLNARVHAWKMMNPQHLHHSGQIEGGGKVVLALPDSEMFDDQNES